MTVAAFECANFFEFAMSLPTCQFDHLSFNKFESAPHHISDIFPTRLVSKRGFDERTASPIGFADIRYGSID